MTALKTSTVVALHVLRHKCSQSAKNFRHRLSMRRLWDNVKTRFPVFLRKTGMGWTCHLIE